MIGVTRKKKKGSYHCKQIIIWYCQFLRQREAWMRSFRKYPCAIYFVFYIFLYFFCYVCLTRSVINRCMFWFLVPTKIHTHMLRVQGKGFVYYFSVYGQCYRFWLKTCLYLFGCFCKNLSFFLTCFFACMCLTKISCCLVNVYYYSNCRLDGLNN